MKKTLRYLIISSLVFTANQISVSQVTYCYPPSDKECVRVEQYVGNVLVSTTVYYGVKGSPPPSNS